jgi:uncharacterized protein (DUF1800 family)
MHRDVPPDVLFAVFRSTASLLPPQLDWAFRGIGFHPVKTFSAGKKMGPVAVAALFVAFLGSTPPAFAISSAVNISTRMKVETNDNVLISGFIITGSGQKKILARALGPSLPVPGVLSNPMLELHDATGAIVASNDNWRTSQQEEIIAAGLAPNNDKDSALIATLGPGDYTVVVRGVNNSTGVALVEVYDLDSASTAMRLGNISTRGDVLTNDNVMIGGFIVRGDLAKRMIMRVRGPTLTLNGSPINGRLMDPLLELHDGNGALIAQNDNWKSTQQVEIEASALAPTDDREPAIVSTLAPGNYTAIVRGSNNTTGIALIEIYDLDQPPQADGSTLYVAQLLPQSGATTEASGSATLRLSADDTFATVTFTFSNLTGPVTGMHVHGPNGQILFDIDAATPQPDGSYIWVFAPVAGFTVADIVNFITSGQTYLNIHTAAYPSGEIKGYFNLSRGAQVAPVPTPPPPLPSGTPTAADAARFLAQSTFGATDDLMTKVQSEGFNNFLNDQFATPPSSLVAFVDASGVNPPTMQQTMDAWWTYAISAPDQLRRRVAFALSEFFVVSANSAGLNNEPIAMAAYADVLARDAFGNFRQLLEDVTLNPAMGKYLDMLHNDKADSVRGTNPNENYAREIMQLFSIGLYRLNLDGGFTLDSQGLPIATYGQDAVLGLAAVFTGWNFAQSGTPVWYGATPDYRDPMAPVPTHHQGGSKTILDGVVIPDNQTPQQDLKMALDTIFNHPNVGPFFCRQLIQRLVTSNPSPGYVYRVASVFNDNGQGVRGDLTAVIRTILTDYDARGVPITSDQGYGHEREPVVRFTNLLRAFHASTPDEKFSVTSTGNLGEVPLHAPNVFNFFSPDYEAAGAIAGAGLKSPEFEITTETTVIAQANLMRNTIYFGNGPTADRITLDLSPERTIAGNPAQLVDHLNTLLMAGGMSSSMNTTVTNAVSQIPVSNPAERVNTAIYLIINSPEFVIEK